MSTRCQIGFFQNKLGSPQVALIYQHYDGVPENMIPKLTKIYKWFISHRGYYDPSCLAARTLQSLMNESDDDIPERFKKEEENEMIVSGFRIDNELHGDLSYFYQVYEGFIKEEDNIHKIK